jgi:hypothetical protein
MVDANARAMLPFTHGIDGKLGGAIRAVLGLPKVAQERGGEANFFAMRTQLSHETSGSKRIVVCNVVADLLKIDLCQGPNQSLHERAWRVACCAHLACRRPNTGYASSAAPLALPAAISFLSAWSWMACWRSVSSSNRSPARTTSLALLQGAAFDLVADEGLKIGAQGNAGGHDALLAINNY